MIIFSTKSNVIKKSVLCTAPCMATQVIALPAESPDGGISPRDGNSSKPDTSTSLQSHHITLYFPPKFIYLILDACVCLCVREHMDM